jgi:hypothetical protein
MRLVMAGGTRNVSVWLEAETPEETAALQSCAARGEWANGRGTEAIGRLRALSERLGYPVRDPNRLVRPTPPCLVVVRRGERDLYERLTTIARDSVTVVWDRRQSERRKATDRSAAAERRRQDRRQPPPPTWTLGFLVVQFEDAPP